jgi:hypothetical protein
MNCYSCGGDRFVKQKASRASCKSSFSRGDAARARGPHVDLLGIVREQQQQPVLQKSPQRDIHSAHTERDTTAAAPAASQSVQFLNYFYYSIFTHTPPYLGLCE